MRTVGITTLKKQLTEYLRLASAGETFLITNRGKVVAEFTPPKPRTTQDAEFADLVRKGLVAAQ